MSWARTKSEENETDAIRVNATKSLVLRAFARVARVFSATLSLSCSFFNCTLNLSVKTRPDCFEFVLLTLEYNERVKKMDLIRWVTVALIKEKE